MKKQAMMDGLRSLGDQLASIRPSNVSDSWKTALIGAALGAGTAGAGRALSDPPAGPEGADEEDASPMWKSLLRGGVIGGAAGAALPVVSRLLGGKPDMNMSGISDWLQGRAQPAPQHAAPIHRRNLEYRPSYESAADFLGRDAPNKTVGTKAELLAAAIPVLGPYLAARSANAGSDDFLGHTRLGEVAALSIPGLLGTMAGIRMLRKGKGPLLPDRMLLNERLPIPNALVKLLAHRGKSTQAIKGGLLAGGGNILGTELFNYLQGNKYSDAMNDLVPQSVVNDTSLPASIRSALRSANPSDMRDAILSASKFLPKGNLPETFRMAQALTPAGETPAWYTLPHFWNSREFTRTN